MAYNRAANAWYIYNMECLVHFQFGVPGTFIIWNAWYIYISLVSRQAVTTVDAENRKQDR